MKKRLISILLLICILFQITSATAFAAVDSIDNDAPISTVDEEMTATIVETGEAFASGQCGEAIDWNFDATTGVLALCGNGAMDDYSWYVNEEFQEYVDSPWYALRDAVTQIIIDEGITSIGSYAFADCWRVVQISIPNSVEKIGEGAFDGVNSMSSDALVNNMALFANNSITTFANDTSAPVVRYSVLILDTSGSMSGTPISVERRAAIKFCESVLAAEGKNYVAVVKLNATSSIGCEFSDDLDTLTNYINSIYAYGGTNTNQALIVADELLASVPDDAIKNIVLCSDGLPENGITSSDGPYTSDDYSTYRYANALYNTAASLKEKYNIYSLAFFHSLSGKALTFGRRVMMDCQNAGYYEVTDPDDLEFVFGEIAGDIVNSTGKFKYAGQIEKSHDSVADYYYDDAYFYGDAFKYNPSLATMSLCLELSSWSSYDKEKWYKKNLTKDDPDFWEDKLINAKTLLLGSPDEDEAKRGYGGIGFYDFMVNDFWTATPTKDSIGVIAARKQITDDSGDTYTLIALVIRGGGYGSEWASNFTIGSSGEHQGFGEAKNEALKFLNEKYIPRLEDNESRNIKLWVVGFSRAGATANMVAGDLNNGEYILSGVTLEQKDTYCYTFEAPMGALTNQITGNHENIHNIINLNDLVPYVAPYKWKFTRYNIDNDWNLPTPTTTNNWNKAFGAMKTELARLGYSDFYYTIKESSTQSNLKIDKSKFLPGGDPLYWWEDSEVLTSEIIVGGVDFLAEDFAQSRSYYNQHLEHGIRQLLGIFMHFDDNNDGSGVDEGLREYLAEIGSPYAVDQELFLENFSSLFTKETAMYILQPMTKFKLFYSFDDRLEDVKKRVRQQIVDKLGKEVVEDLEGFAGALTECLCNVFVGVATDMWNNNTDTLNLLLKFFDLLDLSTMIKNIGSDIESPPIPLANAHFPEICLAWVRSQDPNYTSTQNGSVSSSITRIIRINCPVDVAVYSGNQIVASIVDDTVVDVGGSIICLINNKGEKLVYLPGDGGYEVKITATDSGSVSYVVNEYNYLCGGETRLLNYDDVLVNAGDVLTGTVPAIPDNELTLNSKNGSTVVYTLTDGVSNINYTEYTGEDIQDLYCEVTLIQDGNSGYIDGAGTFLSGHYAQVEAQILPNGKFLGWFVNDTLVSENMVFRFAVTEDVTLTAKFSDIDYHDLKITSTQGGVVTGEEGVYSADIEIGLIAVAAEGYEFVGWSSSDGGNFIDASAAETSFIMPDNDATIIATFKRVSSSNPGGNHTHAFANWQFDSIYHWRPCIGCGMRIDVSQHTFVNGKCSVCGYTSLNNEETEAIPDDTVVVDTPTQGLYIEEDEELIQ